MVERESRFQIIVPAYNEEESLESVLNYALARGYLGHVLVVDDASNDSTVKILKRWADMYGLRAIRLKKNSKKEGAIRVAMEALLAANLLKPYTLLLDSDSMLVGDGSGSSVVDQIDKYIDEMERTNLAALALRIDAAMSPHPSIFELCAFADYTAMQFDQWLVSLQKKLWVINGPGGLFRTASLLPILREMEPDFETGDLLITVKLMMSKHHIGYTLNFGVETFVPRDIKTYFNQRRRWERGTTKVLYREGTFYLSLFPAFQMLGLLTIIHLSLYIGIAMALILMVIKDVSWMYLINVLFASATFWMLLSLLKGVAIHTKRRQRNFLFFSLCAVMNGLVWMLITTPARITGFTEGVRHLLKGKNLSCRFSDEPAELEWLGAGLIEPALASCSGIGES